MDELPTSGAAHGSQLSAVPARLARLRFERNWTLERLSEASGLSVGYLSRLENGVRQPSIAALLSLAEAYGVTLSDLVDPPDLREHSPVIRSGDVTRHDGVGLTYASLTGGALRRPTLQAMHLVIREERGPRGPSTHDGEEWLHVLGSRLELRLGDEIHELDRGDTAHFDASLPHGLTAISTASEVLLVASSKHGHRHEER